MDTFIYEGLLASIAGAIITSIATLGSAFIMARATRGLIGNNGNPFLVELHNTDSPRRRFSHNEQGRGLELAPRWWHYAVLPYSAVNGSCTRTVCTTPIRFSSLLGMRVSLTHVISLRSVKVVSFS